jgi:hypothetical protein
LLRLLQGAVPRLAVLSLALLAAPIVESQRGSPLPHGREFAPYELRADEGRSVNELAAMQCCFSYSAQPLQFNNWVSR